MRVVLRATLFAALVFVLASPATAEREETVDELGRVIRVVEDDGSVVYYRYDEEGRMVETAPPAEAEGDTETPPEE